MTEALLTVPGMCCTGKGSSSGVGFAIPVDAVKGLVQQILQFGKVRRIAGPAGFDTMCRNAPPALP